MTTGVMIISKGIYEITKGTQGVTESKEEKTTDSQTWEKENRIPQDAETALGDGTYTPTNKRVKGAKVYKKGDKYYHRDTLHKGKGSHLEVYDKNGRHIGEADPKTGEIKPGTSDPSKRLPK